MNNLNIQTIAPEINPAAFYGFSGSEFEFEKMIESEEDCEYDDHFDSATEIDEDDLGQLDVPALVAQNKADNEKSRVQLMTERNHKRFEEEMEFTLINILEIKDPLALRDDGHYANLIVSTMYGSFLNGRYSAISEFFELIPASVHIPLSHFY